MVIQKVTTGLDVFESDELMAWYYGKSSVVGSKREAGGDLYSCMTGNRNRAGAPESLTVCYLLGITHQTLFLLITI